jgi:hypothetical protein
MSDDRKAPLAPGQLTQEQIDAHFRRMVAEGRIELPGTLTGKAPRVIRGFRRPRQLPLKLLIELLESRPEDILALGGSYCAHGQRSAAAREFAHAYLQRRLIDAGASPRAISDGRFAEITSGLANAITKQAGSLPALISDGVDPLIVELAARHQATPEEIANLQREKVERATRLKVEYYKVSDELAEYIENKFLSLGLNELDAHRMTEKVVAYFQSPARYPSKPADQAQADLLIDLVASSSTVIFNQLARRPPETWRDRDQERFPTAESFLNEIYKGRLGLEGDLTLTRLKQMDRELAEQLQAELADQPERLTELLPSPTERANAKLIETLGFVPADPRERQNALSVISRGGRPGLRGPYRSREKLP